MRRLVASEFSRRNLSSQTALELNTPDAFLAFVRNINMLYPSLPSGKLQMMSLSQLRILLPEIAPLLDRFVFCVLTLQQVLSTTAGC